jgi:hypothetical protein
MWCIISGGDDDGKMTIFRGNPLKMERRRLFPFYLVTQLQILHAQSTINKRVPK